ncbi:hypothetical protein NPIL_448421 [Nephila pilipes]|uniref:Uncharacterized protein n=1 Tax=Nephila pilipes TaxID=299642 RepID=A0A8X6MEW4_NEPPI|nr:hypothetical protein NPIL_448421 [Nephila pilipes]
MARLGATQKLPAKRQKYIIKDKGSMNPIALRYGHSDHDGDYEVDSYLSQPLRSTCQVEESDSDDNYFFIKTICLEEEGKRKGSKGN